MRPVAIAVFTCATAPGSLVAALTKAGSIVFRAEQGAPTLTRLLVGVWTKRYLRQEWSSSNKQAVGEQPNRLCSRTKAFEAACLGPEPYESKYVCHVFSQAATQLPTPCKCAVAQPVNQGATLLGTLSLHPAS